MSETPAIQPFDNNALFDAATGHLTDEGLLALRDGALDELGSLEAAEHLSFCDACLERYAALLTALPDALKTPAREIVQPVQNLLKMRSIRVFTNRYVAAAAAVALAFGLWQFGAFNTARLTRDAQTVLPARQPSAISRQIGGALQTVSGSVGDLLNNLQTRAQDGLNQLADPKPIQRKGEK